MDEGITEKLFELIIPHADKWESLYLVFMEDTLPFMTAQTQVAVSMRSLRSLTLHWAGSGSGLGGGLGGGRRISLFADTPQLKELKVWNLQLPLDVNLDGQSIQTITSESFGTDSVHLPVEILRSSPELRSFDVGGCAFVHFFPPSSLSAEMSMLPFCHQRLERVSLKGSHREFFRNLRLPSLISLEMHISDDDLHWESTLVTDLNLFLTASGCLSFGYILEVMAWVRAWWRCLSWRGWRRYRALIFG